MYKRKIILITILTIFCFNLSSCKTISNIQKETTSHTLFTNDVSENTSSTFQKLIEESDCCVLISVNPKDKTDFNSKIIGDEYYTDVKVNDFSEYSDIFDAFPERITVIQKESAFLEETNETKRTRFYYLFLNKSEVENTYYITNNKTGVIETDFNYLYPLDESLSEELNTKFDDKQHKPDSRFRSWLTNEYNFSETMYETPENTIKDDIIENTTTNPNATSKIS